MGGRKGEGSNDNLENIQGSLIETHKDREV